MIGQLDLYAVSGTSPPEPIDLDDTPARPRNGSISLKSVALPRLLVSPTEAAGMLGVGRTFFYERVLSELRVIRIGRKRLIPITELKRWAERNAALLPTQANVR
jgi:excisionase family DNA binding protein